MLLQRILALPTSTLLVTFPLVAFITYLAYQFLLHPLRSVPGPFVCKLNRLWLWYHSYIGDECSHITRLHDIYGPVVRIGPSEISISSGAALAPIYSDGGGFLKAACYKNFDIEGHPSIFSALDPSHRAVRAKPVVGLFAPSAIRNQAQEGLEKVSQRLVERLKTAKEAEGSVDLLALSRAAALDGLSGYLFGEGYHGLGEMGKTKESEGFSASDFVDTFVAVGRFFLLPSPVFKFLETILPRIFPDPEIDRSLNAVTAFVDGLVSRSEASQEKDSYQSRMLKAGITEHETAAQCMDLIFAGTDSTGMNLATMFYQLVRHPKQLSRLYNELMNADPSADPQTLPFLRAVIREALRTSMANPTRLPRVTPPSGWAFGGYHFPAGTNVGCAAHTLHLNPTVFPEPFEFRPERWLNSEDGNRVTPEMSRDHIPFGVGSRSCIAKTLAMAELYTSARTVVLSRVLEGANTESDNVEILEWFNSKVKGEKIMLTWKR